MDPISLEEPDPDDVEAVYDDITADLPDGIGTTDPPGTDRPGITVEVFADGRRPRNRETVKEVLEDGTAAVTVRGYNEGACLHPAEVETLEDGLERIDAGRDGILWREELDEHLERLEAGWRTDETGSPVAYETGEVPFSIERPSYHGWALGVAERAIRRTGGETTGYRIAIEPDGEDDLYESIREPAIILYGTDGSETFQMTYGPTEDGYGFEETDVPDDVVTELEDNGLETV
jgi:hypothetical protein